MILAEKRAPASRSNRFVLLVPLLLLAFGLRLNQVDQLGVQADEGVFIAAARQMLAGDQLYGDLFWNHTPGVIFLLATLYSLAGPMILASRLLSVGASVLTVAALYLAGTQLTQRRARGARATAGLWAALFFASAPLAIFWSRFGSMENFATLFTVLCLACAGRALRLPDVARARRWWFLAGSLAGTAVLFKISGLVALAAVGGFLGWRWLAARRQEPIVAGLTVLAGVTLVWLPVGLWLAWQGTADDFLHLLSGADRLAPLANWEGKAAGFWQWAGRRPFIPLALLGSVPLLRTRRPAYELLLIWVALELLVYFLPPQADFGWGGFSHYILPLLAALSLVAGTGFTELRQAAHTAGGGRIALPLAALFLSVLTLPAYGRDLRFVVVESAYPMREQVSEIAIGRATQLVSATADPVLVLGNSAFYHWSGRATANRYFHLPSYLQSSRLGPEAEGDIVAALQSPELAAVLVSGMHREQRLTPAMVTALEAGWQPLAQLPYSYQNSVTVYVPRRYTITPAVTAAAYQAGDVEITLGAIRVDHLSSRLLLAQLGWAADGPLAQDFTVFVHLVDEAGNLVTQHDGWPVMGTRPTRSWQPAESISDGHVLELPDALPAGPYRLRVGLYDGTTGERLALVGSGETFATVPVQIGR